MTHIEIITTGEEVLTGQITDTNASWLSATLREAGFAVSRRSTVGDRLDDLVALFLERSQVADVIVVNGGLGPTVDDLTAEAAAKALGEALVDFPEWIDAMAQKFAKTERQMSPQNLKQAKLPASATIIDNPVGTACGFRIQLGKAQLYFTPGVPSELKVMVTQQILPDLAARFQPSQRHFLRRLHCFGISESRMDGLLSTIPLGPGLSLGFRPRLPDLEVKVMAALDPAAVDTMLQTLEEAVVQIRAAIGSYLFAEEDETLTSTIQTQMIAKGHTVALAESCTGGLVASEIVTNSGSSAIFNYGFVTYANEAKTKMIQVPQATLDAWGAVSGQVACAMAEGARLQAGATFGLAISGVAGPDGGSEAKPVGTVAFALDSAQTSWMQVLRIPNWGRTNIRKIAATVALDMLRRKLSDLDVIADYDLARRVAQEIQPKV